MHESLKAVRRTTAFRGAILTVGMRWTDRLLGLLSTLVLARLLTPEDFGLVAMAMVAVGFVDVLLDLGVSAALVQNANADADDFSTAWTLRLVQMLLVALILAGCATLVADYYQDARVAPVIYVVALGVFVSGLENIGTVSFQRNMEFGRDFEFMLIKRVLGVGFTLAAAVALRSYWALVLGSLFSRVVGVAASYWLSRFRPHLSLARLRQIWAFSQWNLLAGIAKYVNGAIPRFVIGGRSGASDVGTYSLAEEIASMPTSELLAPLGRVMFPAFAAVKHDLAELLRIVSLAQSVQALVAIPACVGVVLVAGDAIPLMLGDQWHAAVPIARIIAIGGIAATLGHSCMYMLMALGRMRTIFAFSWAKAVLLVVLVFLVFPQAGVIGVATAHIGTAFAGQVVLQVLAARALPGFGGRALASQTWRPIVATATMAVVVLGLSRLLEGQPAMMRLLLEVLAGVVAYVLCLLFVWRVAGSPAGAETYVLGKVRLDRGGN